MKINRHILDNGLRLVHSQDESTQMVALNILYNVGAGIGSQAAVLLEK